MSNRAILIRWGMPLAGRERLAVEEFGSYLNWASQLRKEGKIDRFEVYGPRTGGLEKFAGFTVVEGKEPAIGELIESEEFRVRINRLMLLVHGAHVDVCDVGDGMAARTRLYATAVSQLKL
jgi:hypothetical protein